MLSKSVEVVASVICKGLQVSMAKEKSAGVIDPVTVMVAFIPFTLFCGEQRVPSLIDTNEYVVVTSGGTLGLNGTPLTTLSCV